MDEKITLAHGNGGKRMGELLDGLVIRVLGGKDRTVQTDDSAVLPAPGKELVFTTDSYTISPFFFPGGDIGKLAVHGTVNDLAVMGARPRYLSCSLILEEGFPIGDLEKILRSMARAARTCGVEIATGDTKVVEKDHADGIFINTAGIGFLRAKKLRQGLKKGDRILINGTIGDHGTAIMAYRNQLTAGDRLVSDCAPLHRLVENVSREFAGEIRFLRDATRGGIASVLHELIRGTSLSIELEEEALPFRKEVLGVCNLLGIDPLYAANEGKVVMAVAPGKAAEILSRVRRDPRGKKAALIGEVKDRYPGKVYVKTDLGGTRMLPEAIESQLPRIC